MLKDIPSKPEPIQVWSDLNDSDEFLAELDALAARNFPPSSEADWERRSDQLREQEWETAQRLLAAARKMLRRILHRPNSSASFAEITRMLDLASRLGRLATGLATEHQELSGPGGQPIPVAISAALDKIYGPAPSAENSALCTLH